ncbi:hypothetical protein [Pyrococcus abyssi]|uniref:Uncharacterized protein n=1 Tax=Pyrococcus abyssi (strain GE5 / Orsay) TaxID=272844 RepID=G8ZGA6_PYRAB|nr:hypothetical protein [Pyrococcus abyssi]CCE69785.1 TPA: hypothetical protein PAB2078.2n [Pyrococcus abyssi GE5]
MGRTEACSLPKLYVADTGFPTVFEVRDIGYRMENLVAIELLRRKYYREPMPNVNYWWILMEMLTSSSPSASD